MGGVTHGSDYAELHCHTNFSFLDGASHPEELVEEAARLGLAALAVTDHDGFYGVVRFAEAARPLGLPTVFGTELTLGLGSHAVPSGARRSSRRAPRRARRRARPGTRASPGDQRGADAGREGRAPRSTLESTGAGTTGTGDRTGSCSRDVARERCPPRSCATGRARRAGRSTQLVEAFGRDRVLVELWDHGDPLDRHRNDALARARARGGGRSGRDEQRALRDGRATAARDRARRGARPPFARRDRRLAPGVAASRSCARRPSRPAGSRAGPARSNAPSRSRAACAFDLKLAAPQPARLPGARGSQRDVVAARAGTEGCRGRAIRRRTRTTSRRSARSSTSSV